MVSQNEETARFLKLFLQVQPSLRSYLLGVRRRSDDVEEVFQEVSLALLERRRRRLPGLRAASGDYGGPLRQRQPPVLRQRPDGVDACNERGPEED